MLTIDGSMGEGGGQIVRSSLALALVTKTPLRLTHIRAGRSRPGLMRQHLTAVRAAAEVGDARLEGAEIGSQELTFVPRAVKPGQYRFAVGTAGSATLVLQTVLPALMLADGPSELTLEGGTHNPWAPPFDFLARVFAPLINRMGPKLELELERPGFYPAGGGRFTARIRPASGELIPLALLERGEIASKAATVLVAHLPRSIADREARKLRDLLPWPEEEIQVEQNRSSVGPGNCIMIEVKSQHVTELFTSVGQKGIKAESVAKAAVDELRAWLAADVPVATHLADQLLLPLALAGAGRFRTLAPTQHTLTNAEVIGLFLPDVQIDIEPEEGKTWSVRVRS